MELGNIILISRIKLVGITTRFTQIRITESIIQYGILSFLLLFSACANVLPLEGGEIDKIPPKLDSLRSTKNFQTNFKKQTIELTFNEWINLEKPEQIVVSPPLDKKLDVQLKGKTVKVKFHEDEVLRSDATYTINFGESIKDITENNKTQLRFVFSTGAVIDSSSASFYVFDALTIKPVENVLVMLYDTAEDSVVTKTRPFYFSRTDKDGNATIENVRKGKFKVFALIDGNINYKYDLPSEKIGYLDTLINIVKRDSINNRINISLFEPLLPLRVKEKKADNYGVVKIGYSQNADFHKPTWENIGQNTFVEHLGDSIKLWYHQQDDKAWHIFSLKDTILVKPKGKDLFLKNNKLLIKGEQAGLRRTKKTTLPTNQTLSSNKPMSLDFNFPIASIDTSKIKIQDDTTKIILPISFIAVDSLHPQQVKIGGKWLENHAYSVNVLKDAFKSIYGFGNDTILMKTTILPKKNFGDISLKYSGLKAGNQYIIQLWQDGGDLLQEQLVSGKTEGLIQYLTLNPAIYKVQIITDSNRNGRWDSGNYYEKKKPELIFSKKLEDLKPNWTLESEIEIQE